MAAAALAEQQQQQRLHQAQRMHQAQLCLLASLLLPSAVDAADGMPVRPWPGAAALAGTGGAALLPSLPHPWGPPGGFS